MCPPRPELVAPPIGVMPRWLWDEMNPGPSLTALWNRRCAVEQAVARRTGTQWPVPDAWLDELERGGRG